MRNKLDRVVERSLGIPADYQYKALRSRNFLQSNWHNNKLETLKELIKPEMRILDLGTGSGNFELAFYPYVREIVGVDYNPEAVDFLHNKIKSLGLRNVKVIHSDIRKLKGKGIIGKFDLIVMVDVIEHIRNKEAEKVIGEIREYLKPKARVCVITPNYKSTWILIEELFDKYGLVPHLKDEQHLAKYDKDNLTKLFTSHGFKPVKLATFNLVSWLLPNKNLARIVSRLECKSSLSYGNLLWGLFSLK